MTWAERRKLTYMGSIFIIVGGVAFLALRSVLSTPPTCFDGKRNGRESGIDCGGACTFYCKNELAEPKVRWVRTFQVTPGIVHAVAYIEHSYPTAAARKVDYQFKLYDQKNTLITERSGSTFLGPMGTSALVETLIPVGSAVPALTRFSFTTPVPWEKIPGQFSQVVIKTDRSLLEPYSGGTRLSVTVENTSHFAFENMELVAILYDKNDNAITASKVLVPTLGAATSKVVYFTWPFAIDRDSVVRTEVIPRFNPFTAKEL
jgi:hypothetical protein